MLILSMKEGHDGAVVAIEDGKLLFALEAEKDNFPRYDRLTADVMTKAMSMLDRSPDVVALGGWMKGFSVADPSSRTGYFGVGEGSTSDVEGSLFGKPVRIFSSTHERSHIYCALGLAPAVVGREYYTLVWEGHIGSFYRVDASGTAVHLGEVMSDPGSKYSYMFALADPARSDEHLFRFNDAGKQMALTGFAEQRTANAEERKTVEAILGQDRVYDALPKSSMQWSPVHNAGVESPIYKNAAKQLSDAIFEQFHRFATINLTEGLPLLVSGGCGLNCEWNRAWTESGLFASVFVPPCPNDSGSALGTAIDAQHYYTGEAAVEWSVYAGEYFVEDVQLDPAKYVIRPLVADEVAEYIENGNIIGWARGRYEMGPRALGNRSILAAPFTEQTMNRLNVIKRRESYRPIAPIVLQTQSSSWFDGVGVDPYMLYFSHVTSNDLKAVTHVDGTARAQEVTHDRNPLIADLLDAFRARTGYAVLCNTSLNNNGRGFINRTSDLLAYGTRHGLDGYVINDKFVTAV